MPAMPPVDSEGTSKVSPQGEDESSESPDRRFHITTATTGDVSGCHLVDASFHIGFKTNDAVFYRALEQNRLIVCRGELQQVVGYLRWGYFWDDELPYVQMIRIVDSCRRKGLGSRMLRRMESDLRKHDYTHLLSSTDETNHGSMRFHERQGFQVCGKLEMPGDPQEILLLKHL